MKKFIKYIGRIIFGLITVFLWLGVCLLLVLPPKTCLDYQGAFYISILAIAFSMVFKGVWYLTEDW